MRNCAFIYSVWTTVLSVRLLWLTLNHFKVSVCAGNQLWPNTATTPAETEAHDQHVRHLKISTNNILIPVVIGKQRSWKAGQSPPSPAELLSDICCCCERCGVWQYGKLHLLCIFHSKELLHSTENADIDDVQPYTSLIPLHARWTEETVALHQPFR